MTYASAGTRLRSGLPALAVAAVAAMALIQRPGSESPSDQEARLLLDGTLGVRQAYWAAKRASLSLPLEELAAGQALRPLDELAVTHNTKESWRLLALSQHILGVGGWRRSLGKLAGAEPPRPLIEVERELAMWRVVLERRTDGTATKRAREAARQLEAGREFLASQDLGWFRHPVMAALYANHGMSEEARRHEEAALHSSDRLTIAVVLGILACLGGIGIWLALALARLALGREAIAKHVAEFPRVTPEQARSLSLAAAAYFVGLVGLKLIGPLLPDQAVEYLMDSKGDTVRLALTVLISLVSLAPPLLVLRVAGLLGRGTVGILGLSRPRFFRDPLAAMVGYAAVLPALVLTVIISSALFDPSGSPVNPAIEEFVSGDSLVVRALMLLAGAVIAPFTEEIVFRGILLRSLQSHMGTLSAIVVSSAVFAILHPQLPMGFLSIFCLGAAFATLYRVTGSIWPSVLMHAINNATVFAYLSLALAD